MKSTALKRKTPLVSKSALTTKKPLRIGTTLKTKPKKAKTVKREKVKSANYLKKRCDELWRTYIKREGKCVFLGVAGMGDCKGPLNAAHIISRRYARTRYNPRNAVSCCVRHHCCLDGKIEPVHVAREHVEKLHPGIYADMWALAQTPTPMKRTDWEDILNQLKQLT